MHTKHRISVFNNPHKITWGRTLQAEPDWQVFNAGDSKFIDMHDVFFLSANNKLWLNGHETVSSAQRSSMHEACLKVRQERLKLKLRYSCFSENDTKIGWFNCLNLFLLITDNPPLIIHVNLLIGYSEHVQVNKINTWSTLVVLVCSVNLQIQMHDNSQLNLRNMRHYAFLFILHVKPWSQNLHSD